MRGGTNARGKKDDRTDKVTGKRGGGNNISGDEAEKGGSAKDD